MFSSGTTGLPKGYFFRVNLPPFWKLNGFSGYDLPSQLDLLLFGLDKRKRGGCERVPGKASLSTS